MNKFLSTAVAALIALPAGGCLQQDATSLNRQYAASKVYIGALTCEVAAGQGYVFGSSKDLSCVFLPLEGTAQAYDGKIRRFGIDVGATKSTQMVWRVFSVGSSVGQDALGGNYAGEQASITAGSSTGGNWLYGSNSYAIVLQASQLMDGTGQGYNIAYGIAEISLQPKPQGPRLPGPTN